MVLALGNDLGAEGGGGALAEELVIILLNVQFFRNIINLGDSDVTSAVEAISNFKGVDSLVEEFLGLLEDSSSKDHNTGGTVTNLIVLRSRKLSEKLGGLVMDL